MNYNEIMEGIKGIVNNPLRKFKPDELKKIVKKYTETHKKSKELYDRARRIIPGGVEHNLAFNFPFPLASKRVDGCYMWTVDDVKLIDYLMCGGPIILGHNYPPLTEKVIEIIKEVGPCHGITNEYEILAAKALQKHFPSCEIIRWLQTGTEANMLAIRIARVFTKKKWIFKIGGSYHGWADQLVYDLHIAGSYRMESHGIPKQCFTFIDSVFPNDIESLREKFKQHKKKGGIAGVLLEPMGGGSGATPVRYEFNKEVEELCNEYGALLIFDEVVSAFRLAMGGGQEYYGVKPDISVFGKIVGHGYPSAAAIGGRADVMSVCGAGVTAGKKRAYCGGTLAANPLTCAAAYWAIQFIEKTNATEKAGKAGDRLVKGLNELFQKYNLPWICYNFNATIHVHTSCVQGLDLNIPSHIGQISERKEFMEHFGAALVNEEIISVAGSRFYTCMQHTNEIVDETVAKIENICKMIE